MIRGFLPSRCLATIRGFLSSRCLATIGGYTYRHTEWWEGFFHLGRWNGLRCRDIRTKFHKYWFRHSEVNTGDTQTHTTATWSHKPTLFFQNKESGLKLTHWNILRLPFVSIQFTMLIAYFLLGYRLEHRGIRVRFPAGARDPSP
jgi:hypothetical protein